VLERFAWNLRLARDPQVLALDALIGVDYDGFEIPPPPAGPPRVVCPQAVFAELAGTEPEPFRGYLEVQAAAERRNIRGASAVIASCGWVADAVAAAYGIDRESIGVVPLGYDREEWTRLVDGAPRAPRIHPTILTVAKLYPRKGIDLLLRALPRVRTRVPDVELIVVGDGPEAVGLRSLAGRLGVAGAVRFVGDVDDRRRLASYYVSSDCFCLPSRHETFGFVFVEAMLSGLPVVAMRATAVPETIGDAGILVPVDDETALADALASILLDRSLAAEMSRRGLVRANRFDWDLTAAGYHELILRAVSSSGTGRC
jgi:glycosyltransferase involved in cell wall biosynthesis